MKSETFALRGDFIPLDALLKATGLAASGGAAKAMVADGKVRVDGRVELRKTCKIRAGQAVALPGVRVRVLAAAPVLDGGDADGGAASLDGAASPGGFGGAASSIPGT